MGWHLAKILFDHERKVLGPKLYLVPLGYAAIFWAFTLVAVFVPGLFTGPTKYALKAAARLYFPGLEGNLALAAALVFLQGPYLITLFVALTASGGVEAAFASESGRARIELLLAGPYHKSEVGLALLLSRLFHTAVGWVLTALAAFGGAYLLLVGLGAGVRLQGTFVALVAVVPLAVALFSVTAALLLALFFPALARMQLGNSGSLLRTLALLPVLALFLAITLRPDLNPWTVAWVALAAGLFGFFLGAWAFGRFFRAETILS